MLLDSKCKTNSSLISESHKVLGQLIQSLQTVGLSSPENRDLHIKIVDVARQVWTHNTFIYLLM